MKEKGEKMKRKRITITTSYAVYKDCFLYSGAYGDGTLYIGVANEEDGPIADMTKWITARQDPVLIQYQENGAFIDTNNFPEAIEIIDKYKLGVFPGISGQSGFCTYPFCVFDMDEVSKYILDEEEDA